MHQKTIKLIAGLVSSFIVGALLGFGFYFGMKLAESL